MVLCCFFALRQITDDTVRSFRVLSLRRGIHTCLKRSIEFGCVCMCARVTFFISISGTLRKKSQGRIQCKKQRFLFVTRALNCCICDWTVYCITVIYMYVNFLHVLYPFIYVFCYCLCYYLCIVLRTCICTFVSVCVLIVCFSFFTHGPIYSTIHPSTYPPIRPST